MFDFINPILQWLNAHPQLAGLATFFISAAESIAVVGTIVPGSIMMLFIGTLIGAEVIPLWSTIIWGILGAIAGDGISYLIGHHFKYRLTGVWPFRTRPQLLTMGEAFFQKYGGMSVFIGRFTGPVRALVPLIAGMLGMEPIRFYIANILSAIIWAPIYMLPGIILGAASLELPPDIAVHGVLMMVLVTLFILLCFWTLIRLFVLISIQINQLLNTIWLKLEKSRYLHSITILLRHHKIEKPHGQLTLLFYCVIVALLFVILGLHIATYGSANVGLNNSFFHMFRSLRSPVMDQVMMGITFLGQNVVVLFITFILFIYLSYKKRFRTALHLLVLVILTAICIEFFKHVFHSPRPWGIAVTPHGASFPSGHSTYGVVFWLGVTVLFMELFELKWNRLLYGLLGLLIILIGISRIYLGAHWLTDVIGGWLLGTAILMLILVSYNRMPEKPLENKSGILFVFIGAFIIGYGSYFLLHITKSERNYTQLDWPRYQVSLNNWWNQNGEHLPLYRINRFGLSRDILNVQWLGNLKEIEETLLHNEWNIPPERDWISIIQRIGDIQSSERLPLVSPLYLDKKPALVLIRHINDNKKLIVFRLWDSHLTIKNSTLPLWVGMIDTVPRTFSWIFKSPRPMIINSDLLFNQKPREYEIKQLTIQTNYKHRKEQNILFIKPIH